MKAFSTQSLPISALPPPPDRNPNLFPFFSSSSSTSSSYPHFLPLNSSSPILPLFLHRRRRTVPLAVSDHYQVEELPVAPSFPPVSVFAAAASALLFLRLSGISFCPAAIAAARPLHAVTVPEDSVHPDDATSSENVERVEVDEELEAAFNTWKSKTFALSVPLRVVALRGSVPPSWLKDFIQSQSKRLKFSTKFVPSLESIFADLSVSITDSKRKVAQTSVVAADLVTVGDSWLNYAIKRGMIEPMNGAENQDWFRGLSEKWKVYVRRNHQGEMDPGGQIWAAPYRWGGVVIAYKSSKFQDHKLAPIEDWADLWRPELAGRISMVDSPRDVVGAVLKYMGASYNTTDMNSQIIGGKNAVLHNLASLGKQVRLFDSTHYLKAFGVGDVWVAVGWSSDVLPVAKRMSNVAVIVPKSGTSLWADLWAVPAISRAEEANQLGGRVRGPSSLIHQWIEFCLQNARALPFKQEVIPGSIPSVLDSSGEAEMAKELIEGKPKLETNLIGGAPSPEILSKCEFLEPLSEAAASDYKWLVGSMQSSDNGLAGLISRLQNDMLSAIQTLGTKKKKKHQSES